MKLGAEAELQRTNDTAMIFFGSRLKTKLRKQTEKSGVLGFRRKI
jgi:hypothetical protein